MVRDGGTAVGFRQLGPRTARPGAQSRQEVPWRANSTGGKGEGQKTVPQSKTKSESTSTSELAAQIKCIKAQIRLCNDVGRDTESLQNELILLEERRASDKSCNTKLAEQLKVINQCETKISATSAEIARLRTVLLEKEDELQKLQSEKSEAEIAKWELAKANAADLSLDNLLSGFVTSMHTHDELSAQVQRDPKLGQAIAYIQTLVSARRPPETMHVDLEENDDDCDDMEVGRIAAEFKRERDQACADIAVGESRAMQEAKQKRQKKCGETTPLPEEEVAPATPQTGATPSG